MKPYEARATHASGPLTLVPRSVAFISQAASDRLKAIQFEQLITRYAEEHGLTFCREQDGGKESPDCS